MRDNPDYALTDIEVVRQLVRDHPWATLVSAGDEGLVASHYPFLLEESATELTLLSHVGRPDEVLHSLGEREVMVIVEGPHGYISPSWYQIGPAVPTWNYSVVHLYGTPQVLPEEENLAVLERLVDHFEDHMPQPYRMRRDAENSAYVKAIVRGTVGFRLPVSRFVAKEKMSQDKPAEVIQRVMTALETPGRYSNPALAARMRMVNKEQEWS